ncbi:MAG: formate--tetrahydrofolate ligase, partial [Bacteroidaceae bacterium]
DNVVFAPAAKRMIEKIREMGLSHFPICIAKTQYSFSADQKAYGVPKGFTINIRDIVINCGAELIVLIAGDILRMPGLPKSPQAERIDIVDGEIVGLS